MPVEPEFKNMVRAYMVGLVFVTIAFLYGLVVAATIAPWTTLFVALVLVALAIWFMAHRPRSSNAE